MKSILLALSMTIVASSAVAERAKIKLPTPDGGGSATAKERLELQGVKLAEDQTFTFRTFDEPSTFDPGLLSDTIAADISRQLFEGLYEQDNEGNLVPALAAGRDVSEDGKTYTFHLRPDAKWSNGQPVTAHDFVYAWRRVVNPETNSSYAWYIGLMSVVNAGEIIAGNKQPQELGIQAIDDYTLQVQLDTAISYFPMMLTLSTTFPVPRDVVEEHGDLWVRPDNIVSNGAYKLQSHTPNEQAVLVRNPHYWNDENTILDELHSLVINDENIAFTRYLAGELDKTDLPTGQFPKLKKDMPTETFAFPRFCTYYYAFNRSETGLEALQDVRVRKALSYAIDREILTERVLQSGEEPTFTLTPKFTAGFTEPSLPFMEWDQQQRIEEAQKLLADAGYTRTNPLKLNLLYNTGEPHKKVAVTISAMWKRYLGVVTTLENVEWKTMLNRRSENDYEVTRHGWCGDYNEASTFLNLFSDTPEDNVGGFFDPVIDGIMKDAKQVEDPASHYTMAEAFLQEQAAMIPLFNYSVAFLMKPDLQNWPMENVEQRWYAKNLYKTAD